jgi:hypothetical protein
MRQEEIRPVLAFCRLKVRHRPALWRNRPRQQRHGDPCPGVEFGDCAVIAGTFTPRATNSIEAIEGTNRFSLVVVQTSHGPQITSFQATSSPQ